MFWTFLRSRRDEIERQLGGPVSAITPVPSKRGKSYGEQPLRAVLAMAREIDELLAPVITYQPDPEVRNLRASYYPQCFRAAGESPSGQRILLVEDTWVSGATTVSAAGSLLEQGAESVLAVPIARVLDTIYWSRVPTWPGSTDGSRRAMRRRRGPGAPRTDMLQPAECTKVSSLRFSWAEPFHNDPAREPGAGFGFAQLDLNVGSPLG